VLSDSAALSDAAATALSNSVKEDTDTPHALHDCFRSIAHIPRIKGALVIYRDVLAKWGEIPQLVRV